jgi:hypothetical protein
MIVLYSNKYENIHLCLMLWDLILFVHILDTSLTVKVELILLIIFNQVILLTLSEQGLISFKHN